MNHSLAIFWILLAGVLWGTTGTAQTFAPEHAQPIVLGAMRLLIGGGCLLLFVWIKGKLSFHNWPIFYLILAAISMAAYQPLFFYAVKLTGVAVGTVVAIGSAPILSGLLEWGLKGRRPQNSWYMATCLALTGCLLLLTNDQELKVSALGVIMAVGAGLSFALYTLMSKQILEKHPPESVVAIIFSLSAILLIPVFFLFDFSWLLQLNGMAVAVHLGLVTTALAYLLFARGLLLVSSSTAVTLALAEPLTAALLSVLIVGEQLSFIAWLGVGFLLCGLSLLSLTKDRTSSRKMMNKDNYVDNEVR